MKRYAFALCAALLFIFPAYAQEAPLPAGIYKLDPSHASLVFGVSHMGFSHYTMTFNKFDATLELDPAHPEQASVTATIDPLSIDLPTPPEGFTDTISKDKNWLNAGAFPQITFTSTKVEKTGDKTADIYGDLDLLGVKKPVVLKAVFNGGYAGNAMDPHARLGFSATGSFKRSDFGMTYGIPAPGTTMGVGDEIDVVIEAEFSGPALEQPAAMSTAK